MTLIPLTTVDCVDDIMFDTIWFLDIEPYPHVVYRVPKYRAYAHLHEDTIDEEMVTGIEPMVVPDDFPRPRTTTSPHSTARS